MLYAYLLQLRDWAQWHIFGIKAWMNAHADLNRNGREQSTKDLRAFYTLYYHLHTIIE